ncbi:Spermidine/putrescine import ATP-binding protein PotA [Pseudooceanicola marinus]|uniref:Spermidine/putrescine import ATP-binding protein PotA n=1 Tax=Pseudooceanicola marinus TaxID=396013 RepID=A0A1X6YGX7_9RHOB|nr:ABC transporter ATP-binding protein [Pseudooceanicola marinus]SLN21100.1 Spermidine/putrescine import ATP-binding protein PotA [Pseudooceanicola marinus]
MDDVVQAQTGTPPVRGAEIAVDGLAKHYGSLKAVDEFAINIRSGEFLALLGPSGSGKSTILMMLAGFEVPTAGRILIDGVDCTRLPPQKRNIGMVFQHYSLFPHMTVADNVAFPLKMRGVGRTERRRRAAEALKVVRLDGYGARMPSQLSGGQRQRVALARAIVYEPRLLLMDEPLSALDKNLREEMQLEIKRLHHELGITVVFVTHDQGEALTMADRVAILRGGKLQQLSPARELYERPANLFAAGFIGEMNMIPAQWDGAALTLGTGERMVPPTGAVVGTVGQGAVTLAIRPERLTVCDPVTPDALQATLREVVYAGAGTLLIAALPDGTEIRARVASASLPPALTEGETIGLSCPPEAMLVYGEEAAA